MTTMPPPPPPPMDSGSWPPAGGPPSSGGNYGQSLPRGSKPDNYLVWAILSTLFCCLPLGVVSIVYAAQVDSKWASGDTTGALEAAYKAKKFAKWSAIAVAVFVVFYVLFAMILVASGSGA